LYGLALAGKEGSALLTLHPQRLPPTTQQRPGGSVAGLRKRKIDLLEASCVALGSHVSLVIDQRELMSKALILSR
jgi:hypothetical protein